MRRFISTLSVIKWASVLSLCCFAGTASAANFSDETIGISIDLDDELVQQPDWRGYRVFRSADNAATVFIRAEYELSLYDHKQEIAASGFDDVGDIDLKMTDHEENANVESGNGLITLFKGRIGNFKVRGALGAYEGFDDQGFYVIAAARPDYWNEWSERYKTMFDTVKFIRVDYGEEVAGWYQRLTGKSLVLQKDTIPDTLQLLPMHLCSNGTLAEDQSSQPAAPQYQTVWSGYAWVTIPVVQPPRAPAQWRIEPVEGKTSLLIRNGPVLEKFVLTMDRDQLLMNGKPASITEATLCQ